MSHMSEEEKLKKLEEENRALRKKLKYLEVQKEALTRLHALEDQLADPENDQER